MSDAIPAGTAAGTPTRPTTVRAYVNERGVDVPRGAPVRAAVAAFDADAGRRLDAGAVTVTDSRGLPVDADAEAYAGAIYRLVPVRGAAAPAGPGSDA